MQKTQKATAAQAAGATTTKTKASIKLNPAKSKVVASTNTKPAKEDAVLEATPTLDYSAKLSVERAAQDDTNLAQYDRAHYVAAFKRGVEKTARATLEMCRIVYEANRMLDSYHFQHFCKEIGYSDNSSTIRKFVAIGKVYPRFIDYADQLPSGWTAIYQITQIPADHFEHMLKNGKRLDELKGKRLQALLGKTRPLDDMTAPLKFDSEAGGFAFGKLVAMRKFDDVDWRAIEKAMNELEARLPVKFVVPKELTQIVEERRLRRYQSAKKHYTHQEFHPDTWDLGDEANGVLPRNEPEVIEG
jgi:hypothetical protein